MGPFFGAKSPNIEGERERERKGHRKRENKSERGGDLL